MSTDDARELMVHRSRFPVLGQRVYLASQCLGPFPREGEADVAEYLRTRQLHNRALDPWFATIEEVTRSIERLLAAPAGSVALRDSATACQAAVLSCIEPRPRRNRIVVTELDFHSSLHLYSAQERRGFDVVVVQSRDGVSVGARDLLAVIDEETALVAVALVSRYSAMVDLAPIVARAREVGAVVVVDAYQAVGVVPLDVTKLGVDALVGGTHKWLSGETGLAFLYVRPGLDELLHPVYPGWFGHQDIDDFVAKHEFRDHFRPMPGARRFQQGTPPMLPIYGSRAGLRIVLEAGVERIRARNLALGERIAAGAIERGLEVVTPRDAGARAGGVCLRVPDPEQVVARLASRGIDVDQRRRTVVRVAPHWCTTEDECDLFLANLVEVLGKS